MDHQPNLSMRTPIDFFEWSPIHKGDVGNLKNMFRDFMCWSMLIVHLALIVLIFIFLAILLLF